MKRVPSFFSLLSSVGVLATIAASPACSSSSSTPASSDYDDVAQSTAAIMGTPTSGGESGSMSEAASLALGTTPLGVSLTATGSFGSAHAGVDYTYALSCTDALGASLPHCGATTNDAQASVSWSGNLTLPDFSASVARSGNWTLSGVQSGAATFNGSGSLTFDAQFQSAFRSEQATADLSYDANYDGVLYDESSHHLTGGSIHYAINAARSSSSTSGQSSASFSMNGLLTFASDGSATLTLDGSHTYSVSVAGTVTKI